MADNGNSATGGIGVCRALGVLFVGLKLGGVIDWSWWWVTAPFWWELALVIVIFGVAFVIGPACRGSSPE